MRELAMVNSLMHERQYLPDEVIFDAGEEGQGLFLVLSGRIKIMLPPPSEDLLLELGPGAFFRRSGAAGPKPAHGPGPRDRGHAHRRALPRRIPVPAGDARQHRLAHLVPARSRAGRAPAPIGAQFRAATSVHLDDHEPLESGPAGSRRPPGDGLVDERSELVRSTSRQPLSRTTLFYFGYHRARRPEVDGYLLKKRV